jgi:hypothetical protein
MRTHSAEAGRKALKAPIWLGPTQVRSVPWQVLWRLKIPGHGVRRARATNFREILPDIRGSHNVLHPQRRAPEVRDSSPRLRTTSWNVPRSFWNKPLFHGVTLNRKRGMQAGTVLKFGHGTDILRASWASPGP